MEAVDEAAARVERLICEANRGRWPINIWQWRAACRRFGIRLRFVPRDILPEPLLRKDVIWCPRVRDRLLLHRYIAHELAEAIGQSESVAPFHCGSVSDVRHRVACQVEGRSGSAESCVRG